MCLLLPWLHVSAVLPVMVNGVTAHVQGRGAALLRRPCHYNTMPVCTNENYHDSNGTVVGRGDDTAVARERSNQGWRQFRPNKKTVVSVIAEC